MSSYVINGPTTIGDAGQLNEIKGNLRLTDIGTAQGTVYHVTASGNVAALLPGVNGQFLQTQGVAANPVWANVGGAVTDTSFSAAKVAGDSFSNIPTIVANWNIAGAQYFNTGEFNTTTGLFTPSATGKYIINSVLQYTNTGAAGNSGHRILEFYDNTSATVLLTISEQPTGNNNISKYITMISIFNLEAGSFYALRFYRSNATGTNTILSTSTYSIYRLR
jgi:hypothetical protein